MTDYNDDNTKDHIILTKGTMVAHYRINEKIGAGGMGEVYLAEDTKLKRKVAIKFLPVELAAKKDVLTRFVREAQTIAKLNHPNIVSIYDVSEFNERPYYVMELIEGDTLFNFSRDKSLSIDTVIEYAIQICQGLGEAHRAGIVHRDIKSANIAVDNQGRIRLLDFGLAASEGDDKLTKTGSTLGTVAYMSPEQISGRDIDHRSDLFSLGVVLYELVAGTTPFRRDSEGAILKAIMEDPPEPLTRYKAGVPDKLQEIISELLEKDKEIRYQSAEGVIADLKRLTYDSQQSSFAHRAKEKKKNYVLPIIFSAAAVVILGVWAIFFRGDSEVLKIVEEPVLIILPFKNLGAEEDESFSDGIMEEIGSRLYAVKGLSVISQRSANEYKNTKKSIAQIGEETKADYVLDGTIRWDKSGEFDRIRIIPRLTKTDNNYLMWSDNYEENLVNIFDVQSKIAEQIVNSLGLTLIDTDKNAPDYAPTTNMLAYNYYLKGIEVASHNFYMGDYKESLNMLDSALILDPNFALAWAKKSINHSEYNFFFTSVDATYHKEEARRAAEMALELDPNNPMSKIAMGAYHNYIERDYDKAMEYYNSAKSEISSNADLSQAIGIVQMRQGKWSEAIENLEEAVRLDPLTTKRYFFLVNGLSMVRDYETAESYINRSLVLDPENTDAAFFKIYNNLLQYGNLEHDEWSFDRIADEAGLAEVSTFELASTTALGLWRFIVEKIDRTEAIANIYDIADTRTEHVVYLNIGQVYDLVGMHDSAMIFYDSAKTKLHQVIENDDYEFHAFAELGLAYAYLGMADSAVYAGKMAMEIMSIEECHW